MHGRKHILVRIAAYLGVFVIVYLLIAAIAFAMFGEGVAARWGAAALALACLITGRYISARVWAKLLRNEPLHARLSAWPVDL